MVLIVIIIIMSVNRLWFNTIFLKCTIASLVFFQASEALAVSPSGSARFLNLKIDYQQCLAKARQAAGIVLSRVDPEPHTINEGILVFFGGTSESTATIMCIEDGLDSVFTVVTNSNGHFDRGDGEAKSISDRFIQIMSGDL